MTENLNSKANEFMLVVGWRPLHHHVSCTRRHFNKCHKAIASMNLYDDIDAYKIKVSDSFHGMTLVGVAGDSLLWYVHWSSTLRMFNMPANEMSLFPEAFGQSSAIVLTRWKGLVLVVNSSSLLLIDPEDGYKTVAKQSLSVANGCFGYKKSYCISRVAMVWDKYLYYLSTGDQEASGRTLMRYDLENVLKSKCDQKIQASKVGENVKAYTRDFRNPGEAWYVTEDASLCKGNKVIFKYPEDSRVDQYHNWMDMLEEYIMVGGLKHYTNTNEKKFANCYELFNRRGKKLSTCEVVLDIDKKEINMLRLSKFGKCVLCLAGGMFLDMDILLVFRGEIHQVATSVRLDDDKDTQTYHMTLIEVNKKRTEIVIGGFNRLLIRIPLQL